MLPPESVGTVHELDTLIPAQVTSRGHWINGSGPGDGVFLILVHNWSVLAGTNSGHEVPSKDSAGELTDDFLVRGNLGMTCHTDHVGPRSPDIL